MDFGKLSTMSLIAAVCVLVLVAKTAAAKEGVGAAASLLALIVCIPGSIVLGIAGLFFDERKWLAAIAGAMGAVLIYFWFNAY